MSIIDKTELDIWSNEIIPYAGAGISLESGVPLAKDFVLECCNCIFEKLEISDDLKRKYLKKISQVRMEIFLNEAKKVCGEYYSPLSSKFDLFVNWKFLKPNIFHYFLAHCLKDPTSPGVVLTTNIDNLIEQAFQKVNENNDTHSRKKLEVVYSLDKFKTYFSPQLKNSKAILFKLHGSICDENNNTTIETIQMSLEELEKSNLSKGRADVLCYYCENNPMLFIGYSGCDDFDLFPLLASIKNHKGRIWIDHIETPVSKQSIYRQNREEDRVDIILKKSVSLPKNQYSSMPTNRRIYMNTREFIRQLYIGNSLKPKNVIEPQNSQTTSSNTSIKAWINAVPEDKLELLVVRLLELSGAYNDTLNFLNTLNNPYPLERMKCLKELGRVPEIDDIVTEIPASDKLEGYSIAAFANRDDHNYMQAFKYFRKAENLVNNQKEDFALQARREIVWGYRDIARVTAQFEKILELIPDCEIAINDLKDCMASKYDIEMKARNTENYYVLMAINKIDTVINDSKNDKYNLAKAMMDKAWLLKDYKADGLDQGLTLLQEAEDLLTSLGDVILKARILRDKTWFLKDLGRIDDALESIQLASWIYYGLDDKKEIGWVLRDAGVMNCQYGNLLQGIAQLNESIQKLQEGDQANDLQLSLSYRERANVNLERLGNFQSGFDDLLESIKHAKEANAEEAISEFLEELRVRFTQYKHFIKDKNLIEKIENELPQ